MFNNIKLTKAQKRALILISSVSGVYYSPGDSIYVKNKNIRWDVIKNLKTKKIIEGYGLHEFGVNPVYGLMITDLGRQVLINYLNEESK